MSVAFENNNESEDNDKTLTIPAVLRKQYSLRGLCVVEPRVEAVTALHLFKESAAGWEACFYEETRPVLDAHGAESVISNNELVPMDDCMWLMGILSNPPSLW